jgi:hypothetical protein
MGNVYNLCRVQTIITVVLTVMSGMDPHMISENLGWVFVKSWLGCVEWVLLSYWSVTVRLHDVIESSSLRRRVHYMFTRLVKAQFLPLLSASQTKV